jgi:glucose-1-phosphate thymidylyltransferase
MKWLIFGNGYLGSRMTETWPEATITEAKIDDKEAVRRVLEEHQPEVVINAAGVTGQPNIDWCETHQEETTQGNTVGPLVLAEACHEKNIYFVHLGTGDVFQGPSPDPNGWRETDAANPASFYARSKYAADLLLGSFPNTAIVRLRLPIDEIPSKRNLIDKLSSYPEVLDTTNSVTVVPDFINTLAKLIEKRGTGIFHLTNPGALPYRLLLDLYRQYVDPTHTCRWIMEQELVQRGLSSKIRSNSILQSTRLEELGISMRPVKEAVRDVMLKYAQHASRITHHTTTYPQPFNFMRQQQRKMKGIILAGGKGTRLAPLTHATNKHLVPVFNKQMILYPLQTLLDTGIRDIMLITGPDFAGQFMNLLGSGASRGCRLTYRIQDEAGGIAHALGMAEGFVDGNNCTVILGDNVFDENFLPHVSAFQNGAVTFYKPVDDPERFGVVEIDSLGNVLSIEEKPKQPKSNFAQVGFYIYDSSVFEIIRTLKPSARGELEIAEVNSRYLAEQKLVAKPVRGFWSDAGTFPSLKRASDYFAQKEGLN